MVDDKRWRELGGPHILEGVPLERGKRAKGSEKQPNVQTRQVLRGSSLEIK